MKKQEQATIEKVTSLAEKTYNIINTFASGDGRWLSLMDKIQPVCGEEPDHDFAAELSDLRLELENLVRVAHAELDVLGSVLEHYDDYMNAKK